MKNLLVMFALVMAVGISAHAEAMVCMKDKKAVDLGKEKDAKKLEAACTAAGGKWGAAPKKKAGGGGW